MTGYGAMAWKLGQEAMKREGGLTVVSIPPTSVMTPCVPGTRLGPVGEKEGVHLVHIPTISWPDRGHNSGHV